MTILFEIQHTTHYRYARPVRLGEHRVLFRPRESHDLRVLATDLQVTPEPLGIRLIQDAYSNSVALVTPRSPALELKVECSFTVEHTVMAARDTPRMQGVVAPMLEVDYDDEDRFVLAHYLKPYYDDPRGLLRAWARQFVRPGNLGGPRVLLAAINRHIGETLRYQARDDEGVQTPHETLLIARGSCRDFATLMIEALRHLGIAARFVSGYLYSPALDGGSEGRRGAGATHAWVQVYLPRAGWIEFDPTNNLAGGADLIRTGVARHASQASPVSGSWHGFPGDYLGLWVDVQVRKLE